MAATVELGECYGCNGRVPAGQLRAEVGEAGVWCADCRAANRLDRFLYFYQNAINDENLPLGKLDEADKKAVEDLVQDAECWLESHYQHAEKEEFDAKKKEVEGKLRPIMAKLYQGGMVRACLRPAASPACLRQLAIRGRRPPLPPDWCGAPDNLRAPRRCGARASLLSAPSALASHLRVLLVPVPLSPEASPGCRESRSSTTQRP